MSMLILGVSLLLAVFAWNILWQKTLLDTTKDLLLDICDETREWFIVNRYGLNHPIYKATRKMLDTHLSHVETMSLMSYFLYILYSIKNKDKDAIIEKNINKQFHSDDAKLNIFVDSIRQKDSIVLMNYMCKKNFLITFFSIITLIFIFIKLSIQCIFSTIFCSIWKVRDAQPKKVPSMLSLIGSVPFFCARIPNQSKSRMTMEKYSFLCQKSQ